MQDFKKSYPIQTLKEEGDALNVELQECNFNLEKYEKAQKNTTPLLCKTKTENKREKVEFKDVDDFHSLVAITGNRNTYVFVKRLRIFLKLSKFKNRSHGKLDIG